MPNEEAYSYYERTSRDDAPTWSPRMTAASLEPYFIYNSVVHAPLVAPTPLQIIHGTRDAALLPEFAQQVYDAASGTKELVEAEHVFLHGVRGLGRDQQAKSGPATGIHEARASSYPPEQ
jgi:fermentation-respiration switch protein FrsA (DUF1100 family)